MKKNRILLIILLVTLGLTFSGCKKEEKVPLDSEYLSRINFGTSQKDDTIETEPSIPDISKEALKAEKKRDASIKMKDCSWQDCIFKFGNTQYQVPFSYARISKNWTFNPEDYNLTSDYCLQPNTRTSENIVLTREDKDYTITVGFFNPYDVPITIAESKVYSIRFDISDSSNPPLLKIPGGLKWYDDFGGVLDHVGDPTRPFIHNTEKGYFYFSYEYEYESYLTVDISEETGVTAITIKRY